mgnify:CR=1 FL=1
MNIQTETRGEIHIVSPSGRIDSATASAFEQVVNAEFENGATRLVFDFSQLDYISSAGLRVILIAGKRVRTLAGGKLVLCSLGEQIREVFEISGFLSIFAVAPDLDAAIALLS